MKWRKFQIACLVAAALCVWWTSTTNIGTFEKTIRRLQKETRPHIVFILADDLGWNDVGYHGSDIKTPNLDALAEGGVKLENYYVQHCCAPTRGQLMTGRYQIHTGLQTSKMPGYGRGALPLQFPTMANKLKENGYATHIIGKWHLGFHKRAHLPTHRGFDTHYGFYGAGGDYYTHMGGQYHDFHDNENHLCNDTGYTTHLYRDRAVKIIENHSEDTSHPLFLYLAFQAVHSPMQVPERYEAPYSRIEDPTRRTYAGMLAALDKAVGDVKKSLQKSGLWDNTLLVFSSDNGGSRMHGATNWPLRGSKGDFFEGGIKALGFVSGPYLARKGATSHGMMHVTDWFPTIVSLAGGDTSGMDLDGLNVWNSIKDDEPSPRREILHHINPLQKMKGVRMEGSPFDNHLRAALRVDNLKILTGHPGRGDWTQPPGKNPNETELAPHANRDKNIWLFDLEKDPEERHDLSDDHPDIVMEMLEKLAEYDATSVPPLIFTNIADNRPKPGGPMVPWDD